MFVCGNLFVFSLFVLVVGVLHCFLLGVHLATKLHARGAGNICGFAALVGYASFGYCFFCGSFVFRVTMSAASAGDFITNCA